MTRNNETGEFELVIGNRQLLSGFFIVVLLFAVAFAMGYVVGQNQPHSAKTLADNTNLAPATGADGRPQPVSALPPATQPAAAPTAENGAQPPADQSPQPTTQPATNTVAASTPPAAQPAAAPPPAPAPAPAPVAAKPQDSLAAGSYLQVMALNQADAEVVVRALKNEGFPALLTPARNNLMRVLVGPYESNAAMGKAKTALENAGYHPFKLPKD